MLEHRINNQKSIIKNLKLLRAALFQALRNVLPFFLRIESRQWIR